VVSRIGDRDVEPSESPLGVFDGTPNRRFFRDICDE
jgi:hypothetical protein